MLQEQDEVIDRIDRKLDIVDRNNASAAKIVKSMGSTWGQIKNLFSSNKPKEEIKIPPPTNQVKDKGPIFRSYVPEDQFEVVDEAKNA
jgi:hypothetical protein